MTVTDVCGISLQAGDVPDMAIIIVHLTMKILTIDMWLPALRDQWLVDDAALFKLRELSSVSIKGYEAANSLTVKLLKKQNDDITIQSLSF